LPPVRNVRAMLPPIRPSLTIPLCRRPPVRLYACPCRPSSPLPDELADRVAVGDDDPVGGAQEESRVDDTGDRADRALESRRVADRSHGAVEDHVEVVGHERTLLLHSHGGLEPEVLEPSPAEGHRERQDLDRERAPTAENLDQLVGGDQDHLPLGGRSDDPLSHQRAAVALDEIQLAVDLVGPDEAEGMRRKRRERIAGRRRHGRGTRPSQRIPLRQTARERDYWLRIPISCSKKPRSGGRFVNRAWNASRSTASRLTLERLRTVAVRALSPTSAISPKHSPGP